MRAVATGVDVLAERVAKAVADVCAGVDGEEADEDEDFSSGMCPHAYWKYAS